MNAVTCKSFDSTRSLLPSTEPMPDSRDPLPPLPAEPRPGRYRHYKGNEYRVLFLAHHSETQEPLVVYQALYGARGIWVRPAAIWSEPVVVTPGAESVERFAYIAET